MVTKQSEQYDATPSPRQQNPENLETFHPLQPAQLMHATCNSNYFSTYSCYEKELTNDDSDGKKSLWSQWKDIIKSFHQECYFCDISWSVGNTFLPDSATKGSIFLQYNYNILDVQVQIYPKLTTATGLKRNPRQNLQILQ